MNKIKRILALSLALIMTLSVASFASVIEFTDQNEIPAVNLEAVKLLTALNVFSADGYGDGSFRPEDTITRAQAAKMIYVLCNNGIDDEAIMYKNQNLFVDVAAGSWYEGYVNYCANVGVIAGRGNGVFDPNGNVTGYELMKMLLVVAEYKPAIQGYTGTSWAANVLRDATGAGMTKDCNFTMNDAAPRHWAARLFYNTVLNVECAVYWGDSLITNSGITATAQTVGQKRLGLEYDKVYVTGTQSVRLDGGADVYKYSQVQYVDGNSTLSVKANQYLEIDFDISNDYLGQEVRMVYKRNNANLDFTMKNTTIFGVYPTGTSGVFDVAVCDGAVNMVRKDTAVTYTQENMKSIIIELEGFNGDKAANHGKGEGSEVQKLMTKVYDNAFEPIEFEEEIDFFWYFNDDSGNDARFIDKDDDGIIDYIFVTITEYFMVNNINTSKLTMTSQKVPSINANISDVNFIDDVEVARGDIIAVTENYESGDCIYDVRKIESTKLNVNKWTSTGGVVTSLTLDGTTRYLDTYSYSNALDSAHKVYYIDRGFIVASGVASDESKLSDDLAIITRIGKVMTGTDNYGDPIVYFTVDYLKADGTKGAHKYDIESADYYEGYVGEGCDSNNNEQDAKDTQEVIQEIFNRFEVVEYEVTDYGVVFYPYDEINYANSNSGLNAGYSDSEKILSITDGGKFKVDNSTYFFVKYFDSYGDVIFTKVKGDDLKAFKANDEGRKPTVRAYKASSGKLEVAYLDFTMGSLKKSTLPAATTATTYAVITGNDGFSYVGTTKVFLVKAVDQTGSPVTFSVDLANSFFTSSNINTASDTAVSAYLTAARYRVVKYTVNSKGLATLAFVTGGTSGRITDVDGDNFVMSNSGLMVATEDTTVFYINGSSVSVSNVMTTSNTAYVISNPTTWANEAGLIVINGDSAKNAYTANIAVAVTSMVVAKDGIDKNSVEMSFPNIGLVDAEMQYRNDKEWITIDEDDVVWTYILDKDTDKETDINGVTINGLESGVEYVFRMVVHAGARTGTSNSVTVTTK